MYGEDFPGLDIDDDNAGGDNDHDAASDFLDAGFDAETELPLKPFVYKRPVAFVYLEGTNVTSYQIRERDEKGSYSKVYCAVKTPLEVREQVGMGVLDRTLFLDQDGVEALKLTPGEMRPFTANEVDLVMGELEA